MCRLQAVRGPDDQGAVSAGRLCLGSVRLSIIDLSEAGHMPMSDEEGRWWITYNGEVYNFCDLREELVRLGHRFRSRTDTEVVLHAFAEWGEECLDRFVGMYAFAVYDREKDRLTLVRDRYGIKPLYYTVLDDHVYFSSEVKALAKVQGEPVVNERSLIEWFLYRNVEALKPETLLEGVYTVLPGHCVTIDRAGRLASRRYYCATSWVDEEVYERFAGAKASEVVSEIETALLQCTRDRLVSDVPVGTLCSGGLDSSLITSMAARHRSDLTAFHVSIAGYPGMDEEPFARAVANHLGIELVSLPLWGEEFRAELPRVTHLCDSPLTHPNSVAYHRICRIAREKGVIVLLSGEGADELFGGYGWRYRRQRTLLRALTLFRLLPQKVRRGIQLISYASTGMPATEFHFDSLLPETISFIDRYARAGWTAECEQAYGFVCDAEKRSVLGTMLSDLTDFLTPLLRRLDRMSMGASVECRVPFLDNRLVHRCINLPLEYRLGRRADKWVIRQIAADYLPGGVANRAKFGFPLPLADFLAPLAVPALFRDGFCSNFLKLGSEPIRRLLETRSKNIFSFFNMLSLEIWGRLVFLGESVDEVGERISRIEAEGG